MFDAPKRPQARTKTRGCRFSDEELKVLKMLQGRKTFSDYVRGLIKKDMKRSKKS